MGAAASLPAIGQVTKFAGNVIGDISGANAAADAAQNAALAQQQMAASTRQDILNQAAMNRKESMALAEASPQELAALSRSFGAAEQALGREERLLSAIDPSLMEASKQALSLLRGEQADINKPMMQLRNSQRQSLLNSLRSQYGPGAENTSIGQRALQQFDMESNMMTAQNQQNALSQAFGIASSDLGGRLQRGISGLQGVGQGYGALQERKLNTSMNLGAQTLGALSGTSQQMINSAGAQYTGDALRAQAQQGLFNTALQGGLLYATGGFGGGAKAANPAAGMQSAQLTQPTLGSAFVR